MSSAASAVAKGSVAAIISRPAANQVARSHSQQLANVVMKVRLAREANARRHLGDAKTITQEVPGPLHAAANDLLVRRRSRGGPKLADEVVRTATDEGGKPLHGQIRVDMLLDMPHHLAQFILRETRLPWRRLVVLAGIIPQQMNGQGRAERTGKQPSTGPGIL